MSDCERPRLSAGRRPGGGAGETAPVVGWRTVKPRGVGNAAWSGVVRDRAGDNQLLASAKVRVVDRSSPSEEHRPSLPDEPRPRSFAFRRIAGDAEDPQVLERQWFVRIADVDVEVRDSIDGVPQDLPVFLVSAMAGAGFADRGNDLQSDRLVGDSAYVHFAQYGLDAFGAFEFDPSLGVVATEAASPAEGVRAVVVPLPDAAANVAPRFACASKALARTGVTVSRRKDCVDVLRFDVMAASQRIGLTEYAVAETPFALRPQEGRDRIA